MMTEVLIVIPARKGSSFRNKNRYPLLNKPLIHYTFEACENLGYPVLVTTDDHYIKADTETFGFNINHRPDRLANNKSTLNDVLYYIAKEYPANNYVLLPPTSPLRTEKHIKEAITLFLENKSDSLVSVYPERRTIWKKNEFEVHPMVEVKVNRQEAEPVYITNGSIFIARRELVLRTRSKFGGRTLLYEMNEKESLDVHSREDIELAEWYLNKK